MLMLICDEDTAICASIASALQARGLDGVVTASRLEDAHQMIDGQDVGVAVLGVNMKQIDALQFARDLQSRGVELIIYSSESPRPTTLDDLPHIYLEKSFSAEDVAHVALDQHKLFERLAAMPMAASR